MARFLVTVTVVAESAVGQIRTCSRAKCLQSVAHQRTSGRLIYLQPSLVAPRQRAASHAAAKQRPAATLDQSPYRRALMAATLRLRFQKLPIAAIAIDDDEARRLPEMAAYAGLKPLVANDRNRQPDDCSSFVLLHVSLY